MDNTIKQDYIIDQLGAEDWQMVIDAYGHFINPDQIRKELDRLFPTEDNEELSKMIYEEL